MTPLAAVGLGCVLLAREYTLKRNFVKEGEQTPANPGSDEKQESDIGSNMSEKLTEPAGPPVSNDETTEIKG